MSQVNCGKSCVYGSFLIEWITVFNKFYFHRAGKLATQLTLGKILWLLIALQYLLCTQNNTALLIVLSLGDWRCFRNCLWNNRHGLSFLSIYKIHFLKHFFFGEQLTIYNSFVQNNFLWKKMDLWLSSVCWSALRGVDVLSVSLVLVNGENKVDPNPCVSGVNVFNHFWVAEVSNLWSEINMMLF